MRRWLAPMMFAVACAVAGHLAVLHFAPSVIMDRAMAMLSQRGAQLHRFQIGPRTTPQTQTVVRPSPDLAYSACLFDLSQTPDGLLVTLAATPGYSSLSFFDARTNNFYTVRGNGAAQNVRLLPPGSRSDAHGTIVAPTERGIILTRRLAPGKEEFERAARIAEGDRCGPYLAR